MPKYIDADKMRDNAIRMGFHSTTMTISEFINLQPTADVRTNVRGKWILVKGSNGKDYHKCSECLHTQDITGVKNYCAVCGADMLQIGGDTE